MYPSGTPPPPPPPSLSLHLLTFGGEQMEAAAGSVKPEAAKGEGLFTQWREQRKASCPPRLPGLVTQSSSRLGLLPSHLEPRSVSCLLICCSSVTSLTPSVSLTPPRAELTRGDPSCTELSPYRLNPWQQLSHPDKTDVCEWRCLGARGEAHRK